MLNDGSKTHTHPVIGSDTVAAVETKYCHHPLLQETQSQTATFFILLSFDKEWQQGKCYEVLGNPIQNKTAGHAHQSAMFPKGQESASMKHCGDHITKQLRNAFSNDVLIQAYERVK